VRQWWRHFRDLFILFHKNTLWSHYIFLCCSSKHCLWFDRGTLFLKSNFLSNKIWMTRHQQYMCNLSYIYLTDRLKIRRKQLYFKLISVCYCSRYTQHCNRNDKLEHIFSQCIFIQILLERKFDLRNNVVTYKTS
jgi:hypothetical protein